MTERASRRTLQAVRRDSKPAGSFEAGFWKPTNKREMRRALTAAERFDRARKAKGERNGPLGAIGLEVLRAMWGRVRFTDGCLHPSIEWLMRTCARSRGAIVAALKRLKATGFLEWVRRFELTGGPRGVRGPQVRQQTNAYALALPAEAAALLPAELIPDDERTRQDERAAAVAGYEADAFHASRTGRVFAAWGASSFESASLPSRENPPHGFNSKSGGRSAR